MPLILFRHIADLALGPGAPDQGISLTGRSANQNRIVIVFVQLRDGTVNRRRSCLSAELECTSLINGNLPRFGVDC